MAKCLDFFQIPCIRIAPSAIKDLKLLTAGYGHRYLIFTYCKSVEEEVKQKIRDSFEKTVKENDREFTNKAGRMAGIEGGLVCTYPHDRIDDIQIEYKFIDIEGQQVTLENIEKAAEEIKDFNADVVVIAGGGKGYDIIRSAMNLFGGYFRPRLLIIPTTLSTNAPMTNASVQYKEDGTISGFWTM